MLECVITFPCLMPDKTHHWEAQTLEEKQDKHVFSPSILCTQFSTNNLGTRNWLSVDVKSILYT